MTNNEAPAVALTALTKSFRAVDAVRGIDLTIPRGQTVAILGPNGAGKSTTLNMLLGLLPADSGQVQLFGTTPDKASQQGRIGAMLQEIQPIAKLRISEVLGFLIKLYPEPMELQALLKLANLADIADRELDKLSGGQLQRIKFAIAIAGRPELLVLDEPTAAMDVESRREFWDSMRNYADFGRTVLFSTHYIEEADSAANRIVVIDNGTVVADGSPDVIRQQVAGRSVSINVPAQGVSGLELLPGVATMDLFGGRVRLTTTDADATVQALADRHLLRGLEVATASLEDAFLSLTRHPVR